MIGYVRVVNYDTCLKGNYPYLLIFFFFSCLQEPLLLDLVSLYRENQTSLLAMVHLLASLLCCWSWCKRALVSSVTILWHVSFWMNQTVTWRLCTFLFPLFIDLHCVAEKWLLDKSCLQYFNSIRSSLFEVAAISNRAIQSYQAFTRICVCRGVQRRGMQSSGLFQQSSCSSMLTHFTLGKQYRKMTRLTTNTMHIMTWNLVQP